MPRTALTESSPQNLPAIPVPAAGVVVLVVGIAGRITRLGVFFLPPLQARLVAATLADLTGRALGAGAYAPSGR
jgi:hypothetical protein